MITVATLALANLLFPLGAAVVVLAFALSPRRGVLGGLWGELGQRLGRLDAEAARALTRRRVLWVHAASAGEVAAASGLIGRLAALADKPAVLVTCATAQGRDRAAAVPGVAAARLAPADFLPCVASFLTAAHPQALILVETELWPNMIELAHQKGVTIALVNGRLSDRSFPRYRLIAPLLRPFLRRLSLVAAQSPTDAERFTALGALAARVAVVGNLKHDRPAVPEPAARAAVGERLAALGWAQAPLFVAGSTHPVEEDAVIAAFLEARAASPEAKLVLAPRHPERAEQAAAAAERAGLRLALWSRPPREGCDCLIVDAIGVLGAFYARARAAFVGGTLAPVGGHNILEPALAGCPVFFGPELRNVQAEARALAGGGGAQVRDASELAAAVAPLLASAELAAARGASARRAAESLAGASERTWRHLEKILP